MSTSTEHDLRRTLAEHADLRPAADFTAQVRGRIRTVRRRRAGATSLLAVAGLAAALVVVVPRLAATPHELATAPANIKLPTYDHGGRLAGSVSFLTSERREASFTFTPTSWDLSWMTQCTPQVLVSDVTVAFFVNGHFAMGSSCGGSASFDGWPGQGEATWSRMGVRLGEPTTVTFRVVPRAETGTGTPYLTRYDGPMPDVRVAAGIYAGVPLADYRFPPRPATLRPLPDLLDSDLVRLGSAPGPVVGTQSTTFTYQDTLAIIADAVEPGSLTILLDGIEVARWSTWGYDDGGFGMPFAGVDTDALAAVGLHLNPGQQMTLTVVAERFTDAASWQVAVVTNDLGSP